MSQSMVQNMSWYLIGMCRSFGLQQCQFRAWFLPFSRSMWLVVGMFTFAFTFLFVIQNVAGYCKFYKIGCFEEKEIYLGNDNFQWLTMGTVSVMTTGSYWTKWIGLTLLRGRRGLRQGLWRWSTVGNTCPGGRVTPSRSRSSKTTMGNRSSSREASLKMKNKGKDPSIFQVL